jgi:hypothetical protein
MSTHCAKSYGPESAPFALRIAIIVLVVPFLSWWTWQKFVVERPPKRIDPEKRYPQSRLEYHILDFVQEWCSVQNYLHDEPVYGDQELALHRYLGYYRDPKGTDTFFLTVNAHPPTSVLVAMPFCWLSYPDAFLAWNLLSFVCLGASLWIVVRQLGLKVTGWGLLAGWALLLVCNPLTQQVGQGNWNLLLMLLFTGAWALDRSDKPGWAGVLIGLATAIKLFPGFLLLYYAARGRWRVVIAGTAALVAATLLTLSFLGMDAYVMYYRDAMPKMTVFRGWWINASFAGLFNKLFDGSSGHTTPLVYSPRLALAATGICISIVCGILFVATRRARTLRENDLTFGLALESLLLIAPLTWDHYFLLLLAPLAVLWKDLRRLGNWQWLFLIVLVMLWLPYKNVLDLFLKPGEGAGQVGTPIQVLTLISYPFYGLLALYAVNVAALWREKRMGRVKEPKVVSIRSDSAAQAHVLAPEPRIFVSPPLTASGRET